MDKVICPMCDGVSEADDWNEATNRFYDVYDSDVLSEERGKYYFVCPICKYDQVDGSLIIVENEEEE